ncbi:MAG TPA: uracil-xanthine permease family protein [Tissierellaceae bacterium]|nr:uracil-xanthine permease family protein [Tissierellaceae bacterium]
MTENVIKKSMVYSSIALKGVQKSVLALQHLIAMFGATVLVPILTGFDPSIALFTAGVGTLIFHLVTKGKVPAFLGSSFAFIPIILTIKELYNGDLAYAQGGIMISGLVYVLLSFLVKTIGLDRIKKCLPPHIVGPMIIVIGLDLIPTALKMASENFIIAGVTLGTALLINFKGKGFIKQLSILIAVLVGYFLALNMNLVDLTAIKNSPVFALPSFQLPKFDIGAIAITVPVVLAVFMEHLGDITTNGQVVGENFIEDPGLNRTLLGDGLATMFASLVGGPANTTYGENTGVLAITKNYDPSVLRLAAIFAVILGFVAKIGGILSSIPESVMGGISLMLFSMISLIGVKTIKDENVKFNFRNILVMGTILILGLASDYLGQLFNINIGININDTVSISGLSFAALVAIILNMIISISGKIVDKNRK